ncbi:lachesin-like [Chelonus insularis]|uniref:lachesin-like n=1 Tax=Chelonus insularis TaxID=460826 RepID=UPI00158B34F8|nr:lachesin-like [Chelonus insularis]XP_034948619.1 lachesin-like [Chelonus insularis]XP_034948620.1 lachesin-like [Chelonus insularis]
MLYHRIFFAVLTILGVPTVTSLEPDFLYPLENVTIAQGRDATFTCVVNNLGGYRVSPSSYTSGDHSGTKARVAWIKADTKAILAIHEHVITNNARLSVTHNDYNTWTLNIKNAKEEDRGLYMCQVNTDPMKSQSAFLEVVIPPDIISEETSGDLMVPEGSSAKLTCKARGYPEPEITWRREDRGDIIVRDTNGGTKTRQPSVRGETLVLTKVTRSEMGTYMCIASNGFPPSVSKQMMLHVNFHPMIQVPNQLVGAPTGTNVTLVCQVEASPKAINYWTRETGEMIISNHKYSMSEERLSDYSVQMKLIIHNFQTTDLGGYKCISKNSIGEAESNIRLYDMQLPEHSRKNNEVPYDDDLSEAREQHRLNRIYQGPLRESDSTLQTPSDRNESSGVSSIFHNSIHNLIILLAHLTFIYI